MLKLICFCFFVTFSFCALAGGIATPQSYSSHIFIIDGAPTLTLESKNGDKLIFALDTGAQQSIISRRWAEQLSEIDSDKKIVTQGVRDKYVFQPTSPINLKMSDTEYTRRQSFLTPAKNDDDISMNVFSKFDGILGLDFFCNMNLEIDGKASEIKIIPTTAMSKCSHEEMKSLARPVVELNVMGVDLNILVDTGDGVTNGIGLNSSPQNDKLWKMIPSPRRTTENSRFSNRKIVLAGLDTRINEKHIQLIYMIIDPNEDSQNFVNYNDTGNKNWIDGVIGWRLIADSLIKINFLEPEKSELIFSADYIQPFNRTGITKIIYNEDDAFEIVELQINSPAHDAGLKVGDVVTRFNGERVSRFRGKWLYDLAYNRTNLVMDIDYMRANRNHNVRLVLRDYVYEN